VKLSRMANADARKTLPPGPFAGPVTLLRRADLCARWRCSISTIKRLEADGSLTPIRLRGNVRYKTTDIEAIESAS
jgi:hypothetical protein